VLATRSSSSCAALPLQTSKYSRQSFTTVGLGRLSILSLEFNVGNGDARRIGAAVLDGSDSQSFFSGCMRDQLNDGFQRREWFGTPVDGNEGKEAVFDLVPLTGSRREVGHGDIQTLFIGQGLQCFLPKFVSDAIASPTISGDQELVRLEIEPFAIVPPPSPDALHRKFCRLMIDAHVDKALVV